MVYLTDLLPRTSTVDIRVGLFSQSLSLLVDKATGVIYVVYHVMSNS